MGRGRRGWIALPAAATGGSFSVSTVTSPAGGILIWRTWPPDFPGRGEFGLFFLVIGWGTATEESVPGVFRERKNSRTRPRLTNDYRNRQNMIDHVRAVIRIALERLGATA